MGRISGFLTWLVMPRFSRVVVLPGENLIFFVCRANAFVYEQAPRKSGRGGRVSDAMLFQRPGRSPQERHCQPNSLRLLRLIFSIALLQGDGQALRFH